MLKCVKERIDLKRKIKAIEIDDDMKLQINIRIKEIEENIGKEVAEDFKKKIVETINELGGDETNLDGSGRNKMWGIIKENIPKSKSQFPIGKKDLKGNVITNHIGLKKLYLKTYQERLRNRPIKKEFEDLH